MTVAILGRPNVGKSTLFNRILRRREAVVHDEPGVTRDRHYGATTWNGHAFYVVDTGGLLPRAKEGIPALVRDSALTAAQEADVLLLVTVASAGVTSLDQELAELVRRSGKPALVAVNKADEPGRELLASEFYGLGLGDPVPVSAVHGMGTGELLDRVVALLPQGTPAEAESDAELKIAIIGKPNVGKSSLLNALVGEARMLVHEEPGTTRDAVDTRLRWHGHAVDLIDTAGLRRQARLKDAVDVFAALRTMRSIERADVCLFLLDATEPISQQDTRIAGFAHKAGKGIVVCFNKWDAVAKDTQTMEKFKRDFARDFAFITYAPLLFISALAGQRLHRPLEVAWEVGEARARQLPTAEINRVLQEATAHRPPGYHAGGTGHVKYGLQVGVKPPRFALFVNNPDYFDRSYVRYLGNAMRAAYAFPGSALRLELRQSARGRRQAEMETR